MTGRNAPTPRTLRALLMLLRLRICPYIGIDMSGKNLSERLLLELAPIFMCTNVFARSRYEWARDNDLLSEGLYTLPAPHGDTFREMIDCPAVLARLPWCGKKRLLVTSMHCDKTKRSDHLPRQAGDTHSTKTTCKTIAFPQDHGCGLYTGGDAGRANAAEGKRPAAHTRRSERVTQRVPACPFQRFLNSSRNTPRDRWQQQFYAQKLDRCFFCTEICCLHTDQVSLRVV